MARTKSRQGTRECRERMGFLTDYPRAVRGLGSLEKEWSQGGELGVLVGSCEIHPNLLPVGLCEPRPDLVHPFWTPGTQGVDTPNKHPLRTCDVPVCAGMELHNHGSCHHEPYILVGGGETADRLI